MLGSKLNQNILEFIEKKLVDSISSNKSNKIMNYLWDTYPWKEPGLVIDWETIKNSHVADLGKMDMEMVKSYMSKYVSIKGRKACFIYYDDEPGVVCDLRFAWSHFFELLNGPGDAFIFLIRDTNEMDMQDNNGFFQAYGGSLISFINEIE